MDLLILFRMALMAVQLMSRLFKNLNTLMFFQEIDQLWQIADLNGYLNYTLIRLPSVKIGNQSTKLEVVETKKKI